MGKYIPVEPEKWAEMVKALALVAEMDKTINASQAECRRLKAEVEEARKISGEGMSVTLDLNNQLCADYARLKAEVERLTKAGDNMYYWLGVCGRHNNSTGDDWLRAKKGLPSLTEQWEIEKRNRAAEEAAKKGGQP